MFSPSKRTPDFTFVSSVRRHFSLDIDLGSCTNAAVHPCASVSSRILIVIDLSSSSSSVSSSFSKSSKKRIKFETSDSVTRRGYPNTSNRRSRADNGHRDSSSIPGALVRATGFDFSVQKRSFLLLLNSHNRSLCCFVFVANNALLFRTYVFSFKDACV